MAPQELVESIGFCTHVYRIFGSGERGVPYNLLLKEIERHNALLKAQAARGETVITVRRLQNRGETRKISAVNLLMTVGEALEPLQRAVSTWCLYLRFLFSCALRNGRVWCTMQFPSPPPPPPPPTSATIPTQ